MYTNSPPCKIVFFETKGQQEHSCVQSFYICIYIDHFFGCNDTRIRPELSRYGHLGCNEALQRIQAIINQKKNRECHELLTWKQSPLDNDRCCEDPERVSHIDWLFIL